MSKSTELQVQKLEAKSTGLQVQKLEAKSTKVRGSEYWTASTKVRVTITDYETADCFIHDAGARMFHIII